MTETHSCTASSPEDAETSARQMIDAINRAERALAAAKKIAAREESGINWKNRAEAAESRLAVVEKALKDRDDQLDVLLLTTDEHRDGCLYKADNRMPCQCGWHDRRHNWMKVKDDLTAAAKARRAALTPTIREQR